MKKLFLLIPLLMSCGTKEEFSIGDYVKGVPHSNGEVIGAKNPNDLNRLDLYKKTNNMDSLYILAIYKKIYAVDSADDLLIIEVDSVLKVQSQENPDVEFWIKKKDVIKSK